MLLAGTKMNKFMKTAALRMAMEADQAQILLTISQLSGTGYYVAKFSKFRYQI